jgi:hypothetical protein
MARITGAKTAAQVRQSLWLACADGDHESNPSYRAHWYVREDGWMGASLCRHEPVVIQWEKPFCLRYLLHIHSETVNLDVARRLADLFNASPGFTFSQTQASAVRGGTGGVMI